MAQKLLELTNGVFTLKETEVESQLIFFRNDNEVLKNVGTNNIMELFSKYLLERFPEGRIQQSVYECKMRFEMRFEISTDGKIITMTVKNKPNLQIVKSKDTTRPNIFKKLINLFAKG